MAAEGTGEKMLRGDGMVVDVPSTTAAIGGREAHGCCAAKEGAVGWLRVIVEGFKIKGGGPRNVQAASTEKELTRLTCVWQGGSRGGLAMLWQQWTGVISLTT